MLFTAAIFLALLAVSALGAPSLVHPVQKYAGQSVAGSYVITLKDGVHKRSLLDDIMADVHREWTIINGFSAKLNESDLDLLRSHDDVVGIFENGVTRPASVVIETNTTWNLQRISQLNPIPNVDPSALTHTYRYNSSAGAGVDIYILGVRITHTEFTGRITWGANFAADSQDTDVFGHGTHCAGIAAGTRFGVAKAAHIISVKVLSDTGNGTFADLISGLDYVVSQAAITGRPSIASISIGGEPYQPVDDAVLAATKAGVHVVIASGNDGEDASLHSPARSPTAITVGNIDPADERISTSNDGPLVDMLAPGTSVISAGIANDTATLQAGGTSQACPHVAGLAATWISEQGNASPADLRDRLVAAAIPNAISDVGSGSPNFLAYNGNF